MKTLAVSMAGAEMPIRPQSGQYPAPDRFPFLLLLGQAVALLKPTSLGGVTLAGQTPALGEKGAKEHEDKAVAEGQPLATGSAGPSLLGPEQATSVPDNLTATVVLAPPALMVAPVSTPETLQLAAGQVVEGSLGLQMTVGKVGEVTSGTLQHGLPAGGGTLPAEGAGQGTAPATLPSSPPGAAANSPGSSMATPAPGPGASTTYARPIPPDRPIVGRPTAEVMPADGVAGGRRVSEIPSAAQVEGEGAPTKTWATDAGERGRARESRFQARSGSDEVVAPQPAVAGQPREPGSPLERAVAVGPERTGPPLMAARAVPVEDANVSSPSASLLERMGVAGTVKQIVAQAHFFTTARGKGLRLQLKPPELGSIDVRLLVESGQVTLRVTAETPRAKELIEAGWPRLQEGFAERGLRAERLVVDQGTLIGGGHAFASSGHSDSSPYQAREPLPPPFPGERVGQPGKSRPEPAAPPADPTSLIDYRI